MPTPIDRTRRGWPWQVGAEDEVLKVKNGWPSWEPEGGGADPWTYQVLSSDFTTTSGTAVNITGLSVSPVADKVIVVEANFLTRSAVNTTGVRPGVSWPTITEGVILTFTSNGATAAQINSGSSISGAFAGTSSATTATNISYLWAAQLTLVCGPSPSGTLQFTLTSEIAGTQVDVRAGSWLRYRTIN